MGKLQVCEQHSDESNTADGHFSARIVEILSKQGLRRRQGKAGWIKPTHTP